MKMFIFDGVEDLTSSYHSGGGCVVIADSIERAKELVPAGDQSSFIEIGPEYVKPIDGNWPSHGSSKLTAGYWVTMEIVREAPDYGDARWPLPEPEVFDMGDQVVTERVWEFPDAGCC